MNLANTELRIGFDSIWVSV